MSLDWNVSKISNHESLWVDSTYYEGQRDLNALTRAIIFGMMNGVGWELTEENAAEYYARFKLTEKLAGAMVVMDGKDYFITPDDVKRHIGLKCNTPKETRAAFIKRWVTNDLDTWKRQYEHQTSL